MNLKDFLATREKPPELFWSLVIEKDWVQAGIWYIGKDSLEMLNISPAAAWEQDGELVDACDAALSSCVAKLPEDYTEPNKTVFGVASSWVKDGEIADEHLAKIKEVCTNLSLTPVGFVVLPEAVAHLYKSEEGTPLSAVIVGLGSESLEVTVFTMGNLIGTTSVTRSISLTEDVSEGLSRFEGASPLPSRIIVYDGKGGELEEAKEELMRNSWDDNEKVKFLHTPKAEVLLSEKKVLATSLAGAAEIGDVALVGSSKVAEDNNETPLPAKEEIENISEPVEKITPEELGFVVEQDIAAPNKVLQKAEEIDLPKKAEIPAPVPQQIQKTSYVQKTKSLFHTFSSGLTFIRPKAPGGKNKNIFYIILVLLVGLLSGGGLYYWFVPKATVTIYVAPKTFQEQIAVSFSTSGQFDESKAIIPGKSITANATGDKTKSTTGTKLVGDKSTGSVQIANGNGNPIRLAAGTILTSSSGLRFVTNSEASVSGQLIPGSPGTATLSVTAGDIGAQYNLAKGEVFKVGLFDKSQVAATSQSDFSGGSSQQIAAVSADDQKKLEADLKNELTTQIQNDLSSQVTSDQVFVNDLSSIAVGSETFDHKIGDVADKLKLTLTVNGSGIAADKSKLLQYATNSIKNKIPQGYALRSSQIKFKFTFTGEKDGKYGYNLDISANFTPLVNSKDVAKQISGKSTTSVIDYLSNIPGYSRAEVKLNPPLPAPLKSLPHVSGNITIEVVPEQ